MNRARVRNLTYAPLVAVALLLALFGQALFGSTRLSLTTDEPMHIAMGYTVLAAGDYRLLPAHIHPPLVNAWAAWPLLLQPDRPDPHQTPGWDEGNLFKFSAQLIARLGPIESVELATRVPIMLLALLLGAVVYRWASDLAGAQAGLVAVCLFAFDPGIISSAQFNTTDLGALTFGMLATYLAWRAIKRLGARRAALIGVALGLSVAAKVSGLFFAPMLALLIGLTPLRAHWGKWSALRPQVLRWGARLMVIYALAFGVLWAAYRFEVKPLPGQSVPVPAATHWLVLQAFNRHMAEGQPAFLAGQVSQAGWWWYFPFAFAVKTPLPTLALLIVALVTWARRRPVSWIDTAWLLLIPLAYFVNAMLSTIDIGYRHLLPILPFLFIFIGVQISNLKSQISNRVILSPCLLVSALLVWSTVGAIRAFPHYQAYFNELAGGADGGWRYLADSNTDWGQALKELAAYQREHGIERVRLSMFTFIDPAWYGVRYEPLTPMGGNTPAVFPARFNPPPGQYAISATSLDGIPLADPEQFDWFRRREPTDRVAHTMFIYEVKPPAVTPTWVAQCSVPVAPLGAEQIAEGFGRNDLRQIVLDCSQSWLYPSGMGWYVLSRDASLQANDFVASHLAHAHLTYEQKQTGFVPPFAVYEGVSVEAIVSGLIRTGIAAPSEWLPARVEAEGKRISAPVSLEDGPEWLGYRLDRSQVQAGQVVELETFWQVEQLPVGPLSLMAHLLAEDGRVVSVGDGLGVPVENWQVGDIITQRHELKVPPGASPGTYWAHIGVYTLADLRRLAVKGQPAADRIVLARIKVAD